MNRIQEIIDRLNDKVDNNCEALKIELEKLASAARERGEFYDPFRAYRALDQSAQIRELGERTLAMGKYFDAMSCFEHLGDSSGLFRAIRDCELKEGQDSLRTYLCVYTQMRLGDRHIEEADRWARNLGYKEAHGFAISSLNMAHALADRYDIGVGIARAGLFTTYLFQQLGLPTVVADCHRSGQKGTKFRWRGLRPNADTFSGKRVLVLDDDVRSGRTSVRVHGEIHKHGPAYVDIALVLNPVNSPMGMGTERQNIPPGYRKVFFPQDFSYQNFDSAVDRLEQRLKEAS
ncbi:MAG TPA: phosphoribosyltransferase [Candidatus Nanoarchaeia archaeon]|nr:phosphoribosyltransferase [Candidatus Nanoarchaeia archaeon]